METTNDLDYNEPTSLDDIGEKLDNIENELLLLNEKNDGRQFKGLQMMLLFILITLAYIAFKL